MISIKGPAMTKEWALSFVSLYDAKAEAHAFVHSALETPCRGEGDLEWRMMPNGAA